MSKTPIYQQDRQEGYSRQGPPQYPHDAPGPYQNQPMEIIQAGPASQQYLNSVQQRTALIRAAAKMAEDAASAAGKAADMARQAAEMVSQATNLPWDGPPSTPAVAPFPSNTLGDTGSADLLTTSVPVLQQRQIDQPIESYQSQFSVVSESGTKRKRKARTSSRREAGGDNAGGSIASPAMPGITSSHVPGPGVMTAHGLADYEQQLKLLEEANKRRKEKKEAQREVLQQSRVEDESASGGV